MNRLQALAVMMCLTCGLGMLAAEDWPQFRGPHRDGVSQEQGLRGEWPKEGPPLLWTCDLGGVGFAGPALVGDRLYTCVGRGDAEFVVAYDLKTAAGQPPKELWSAKLGPLFQWKGNSWNKGPNATPTVEGEAVFALGGFGDLVCVESATGKERWRVSLPRDLGGEMNPIGGGLEEPTPLGWGYAAAPLVDGPKLLCMPGGSRGLFAALDKATGKVLWRSTEVKDQAPYASPLAATFAGVPQYVTATNSGCVGVAAADGKLLWRYQRPQAYDDVVIATPIIHQDLVFTTVGFGQGCDLVQLATKGGAVAATAVYSNKSIQNRDGGVVRLGDHLYGHSENVGWFCQDLRGGKLLWSEKRKLRRGAITAVGNRLCCASEEGDIAWLEASPEGYREHGRFKLPQESKLRLPNGRLWTHPVVANGKLYLRDQDLLFCFDLKQ